MSRPSPNKHLMSHTLTKLKENTLYKLNVYLLCKMRRGCRSLSLFSKGSQSITAEVIKAHSPIRVCVLPGKAPSTKKPSIPVLVCCMVEQKAQLECSPCRTGLTTTTLEATQNLATVTQPDWHLFGYYVNADKRTFKETHRKNWSETLHHHSWDMLSDYLGPN